MPQIDLKALSVDKLWQLLEEVRKILERRLNEEKQVLDRRLRLLGGMSSSSNPSSSRFDERSEPSADGRRYYPEVKPLYRNPHVPCETWSGRGNKPRWLVAKLQAGHTAEEFRISAPSKSVLAGMKRRR